MESDVRCIRYVCSFDWNSVDPVHVAVIAKFLKIVIVSSLTLFSRAPAWLCWSVKRAVRTICV